MNCKTDGCPYPKVIDSKYCKTCLGTVDGVAKGMCFYETADFKKSNKPAHYQKYHYTRKLTQAEIEAKEISILMDPYRICDIYEMKGGPREQITKKGLRWTDKDQSERQVIKEIMQACERRIEMMDEDGIE